MVRSAQTARITWVGCVRCSCGVHTGCKEAPTATTCYGALLPTKWTAGTPEPGCPCHQAVMKRKRAIQEAKDAKIAAKKNEEEERASLLVRMSAIENIVWGKTFEKSKSKRRPRPVVSQQEAEEAVAQLDKPSAAKRAKRTRKTDA